MTAEVQLVSFISIFSTSFSRTLHVNSPPERKPFLAETQSYKMLFVKRQITTVVVIFSPFLFLLYRVRYVSQMRREVRMQLREEER